jgi:hypothetical protein
VVEHPFSKVWPHIIKTRKEVSTAEIMDWAFERANSMGKEPRDIYTSFSLFHFGFNDRQIAMEFKLRFG